MRLFTQRSFHLIWRSAQGVDPLLLIEMGFRTFDTVLLAEAFVPLDGFSTKMLKKLTAGFAPIMTLPRKSGEVWLLSYSIALNKLRNAGCRRIIYVSEDGKPGFGWTGRFEASAEVSVFDVDFHALDFDSDDSFCKWVFYNKSLAGAELDFP